MSYCNIVSSYFKVPKLDLNTCFSNYVYGLLTCPANRPHSVAQSVSGEQLDCSDTQPAASSLQKILHSPILFSQMKDNIAITTLCRVNTFYSQTCLLSCTYLKLSVTLHITHRAKTPVFNIVTCSIWLIVEQQQ